MKCEQILRAEMMKNPLFIHLVLQTSDSSFLISSRTLLLSPLSSKSVRHKWTRWQTQRWFAFDIIALFRVFYAIPAQNREYGFKAVITALLTYMQENVGSFWNQSIFQSLSLSLSEAAFKRQVCAQCLESTGSCVRSRSGGCERGSLE